MIDVNLKGVLYTARAALPHLIAAEAAATSSRWRRSPASTRSRARRSTTPRSSARSASCGRWTSSCASTACAARTSAPAASRRTSRSARAAREDMPELDGMMSADDVAEVVLFALTRPRIMRLMTTTFRPDERGLVGIDAGRWGILSTARIGGGARRGRAKTDAADIVAVASRSGATAQAFADAHGIPRAHGSYEALLADPDVEAVYIPLPNGMHVDWTMRALQAGKHVLCEKPMDRRPEQVARGLRRRRGARARAQRGVHVAPQPADRGACASCSTRARSATCGSCARASRSPLAGDVDVRLDPALDGGALMDVGCYCVSGARLVAGGEPVSVSAQAVTGPTGVDLRLSRAAALRRRRARRRSTAASTSPAAASWRSSAPRAGSCSPTRGTPPSRGSCVERGVRARGRRDRAGRQLRASSSRTWPPRSPASARRCSAAPTRSARRARSRRSTARPTRAARCARMSASGSLRVAIAGYGLAGEVFHAPLVAATEGLDARRGRRRRTPSAPRGRAPPTRRRRRAPTPRRCCATCPTSTCSSSRRRTARTSRSRARRSRAAIAVVMDKPLAADAGAGGRARRRVRRGGRPVHGLSEPPLGRRLPDGPRGRGVRRARRRHPLRVALRALPPAGRPRGVARAADADEGGGLLLDLGAHLVDQALTLFGPPRRVYAEIDARRAGAAVDDDVFVALEHDGGVRSHLWMSARRAGRRALAARQRDARRDRDAGPGPAGGPARRRAAARRRGLGRGRAGALRRRGRRALDADRARRLRALLRGRARRPARRAADARRPARQRRRAARHRGRAAQRAQRRRHRLDRGGGRDMKTSLGIWAMGPMVTRFNPAGYKPELAGRSTAEYVRTAVAGLEGLIDDYEFHYPAGALRRQPRRGPRGARRPRHLRDRQRHAPRQPLRPRRPVLARRRDARRGRAADRRRARSSPGGSARG